MTENASNGYSPWRSERSSRRRFRRWFVDMKTSVRIAGQSLECTICDLSPNSAGIRLTESTEAPVGTEAEIDLGSFGAVPAEVRSINGDILGLMFLQGEAHERELARHLIVSSPPRRVERQEVSTQGAITAGAIKCPCVVEDISRMGACVLVDDTAGLIDGDRATLTLEGTGPITASVRHLTEIRVGLMFLESLTGELLP